MSGVPLDKYLAGSPVMSSQSVEAVVAPMMQQLFAQRDESINSAFQHLATRLQQLEAAIGQVALAAQQTKLSPFEVALKALTHCTKDNEGLAPDAEGRCYDKSFAVIERWLDAALETSETGSGDARRAPDADPEAQAEAGQGEGRAQPAAPSDQSEDLPAENG
jgi:hypothetical protein